MAAAGNGRQGHADRRRVCFSVVEQLYQFIIMLYFTLPKVMLVLTRH